MSTILMGMYSSVVGYIPQHHERVDDSIDRDALHSDIANHHVCLKVIVLANCSLNTVGCA